MNNACVCVYTLLFITATLCVYTTLFITATLCVYTMLLITATLCVYTMLFITVCVCLYYVTHYSYIIHHIRISRFVCQDSYVITATLSITYESYSSDLLNKSDEYCSEYVMNNVKNLRILNELE